LESKEGTAVNFGKTLVIELTEREIHASGGDTLKRILYSEGGIGMRSSQGRCPKPCTVCHRRQKYRRRYWSWIPIHRERDSPARGGRKRFLQSSDIKKSVSTAVLFSYSERVHRRTTEKKNHKGAPGTERKLSRVRRKKINSCKWVRYRKSRFGS